MRYKLFIPGPCEVADDILEAIGQPTMRHYGDEWMEIHNETLELLGRVFQTERDILMIPGTGSAALDMAFGSLLATGDTVIIGDNGFFGERLASMAESYGMRPVTFTAPHGEPLDPAELVRVLKQEPEAQAVAVVHHETGTTILNPLRELAEAAHEAGLPILVDAISSLGGVPLPVDEWDIDVCVSVANKCLECPPGLGLISVGPRAWELVDKNSDQKHGWYLNLRVWREFAEMWADWHPYPVTLPTNNIMALRASLRKILEHGLEAHHARYRRAAGAVRQGLEALGFEMFIEGEAASPIATAVRRHPKFGVRTLADHLAVEHGILISGGLGPLAGEIFRVGHMGRAASVPYLKEFLLAVEAFARSKGVDVPEGASLCGLTEVG